MIQPPRILFFVNDCVPSEEQMLEAQGYGTKVSFRNATMVPAPIFKEVKNAEGEKIKKLLNANFLEVCDGVAGDVPELYTSYPRAEDVLAEYEEKRLKALAEARETKAKKEAEAEAKAKADAETEKKVKAEQKKAEAEKAKQKAENEKAEKKAQAELEKQAKAAPEAWQANK